MNSFLAEVGWLDLVALATLGFSFSLYGPTSAFILGGNISTRMLEWRKIWARQMMWRDERITDVSLVRGLIVNVSFFATTTWCDCGGRSPEANEVRYVGLMVKCREENDL